MTIISERSGTDAAVELRIDIEDRVSADPNIAARIFIDHVMKEMIKRRQIFVFNYENCLWDVQENAKPAEVKLFGLLAGLALKHKIPLPIKFEQIYYQAMTGNMRISALKDVMSLVDPFTLSCYDSFRDDYDEIVRDGMLSFKEFGLADEPVTFEKIDRYINLKIKWHFYYSRDHLLISFIQGVRLIILPSEINREYNHRTISAILAPFQDS